VYRCNRNKYQTARGTEPDDRLQVHIGTSTRLPEEQNQRIIYRYRRNKYQTAGGTEPEDHLQVQEEQVPDCQRNRTGGSSAGTKGTSTRLTEEQNRRIIYRYIRNKYQTDRGTEPEDILQVQEEQVPD
jgi:hypothetical protein